MPTLWDHCVCMQPHVVQSHIRSSESLPEQVGYEWLWAMGIILYGILWHYVWEKMVKWRFSGLRCSYVACYCFYVVVQRFFPTFDVLCVVCSGDFLYLTFLGLSVFG